jgi:hypothetical protein
MVPQLGLAGLPGGVLGGLRLSQDKAAQMEELEASVRGRGPRIYVGGVPNAVSETMVRNYFLRWGQVEDVYFPKDKSTGKRRPFCFVTFDTLKAAERAVAESNREISGYQISSISLTMERTQHYHQKGQAAAEPDLAGTWPAADSALMSMGSAGPGGRGSSSGPAGLSMLPRPPGGSVDSMQLQSRSRLLLLHLDGVSMAGILLAFVAVHMPAGGPP